MTAGVAARIGSRLIMEIEMKRIVGAFAAVVIAIFCAASAHAQNAGSSTPQKKYINYGHWQSRAGFSQGMSVTNPGRLIFLSGVGSEEEMEGQVQHLGDFMGQCRAAWANIKHLLAGEGASVGDIVRVVTYVTDPRHLRDNNVCKKEVFGDGPYPPHTFLNVSQLAIPGMLIEVEVTAALPK